MRSFGSTPSQQQWRIWSWCTTPGYLRSLEYFAAAGGGISIPTPSTRRLWSTALLAAGAGLAAIDALRRGRGTAASSRFVLPATMQLRERPSGFCLLNNVAVAAAALRPRRAGADRRLGRAPRQRHAGHLLGRPPGLVRVDAPVAGVSRARAGRRDRRSERAGPHGQLATAPGLDRRRRAGGASTKSSAPAIDDSRRHGCSLGGLRRAPRRSARRSRVERRRLRAAHDAGRRIGTRPGPVRRCSSRAATTSPPSGRSVGATVAALAGDTWMPRSPDERRHRSGTIRAPQPHWERAVEGESMKIRTHRGRCRRIRQLSDGIRMGRRLARPTLDAELVSRSTRSACSSRSTTANRLPAGTSPRRWLSFEPTGLRGLRRR